MGWIASFFKGRYLEWNDYVQQLQKLEEKNWEQYEKKYDKKVNYSS